MSIIINGREFKYVPGLAYKEYIDPSERIKTLAFLCCGEPVSPNTTPQDGTDANTLTFADEEGRRIYERSLQFLFLMAVRNVMGDTQHVRIEHSLGQGIYITLKGVTASDAFAASLEAEMHTLADKDLPFVPHTGTKKDALHYFETNGQTDKVRLLNYRNFDHFLQFTADGYSEYFYGAMVPSTSYVSVFRVVCSDPGLLLMLPDPKDPSIPAVAVPMPKLKDAFRKHTEWSQWQHITNAADLNERITNGGWGELVRVCEGRQEHAIYGIAEQFIKSKARLLLIAGPSSSGKTTTSYRIQTALTVLGMKSVRISLDDYYLDRRLMKRDEFGELDFERLDALNVPLLCSHLETLLRGEPVDIPHFNFHTGCSEKGYSLQVDKDTSIVIEGIHGLNEELTATIPRNMKFKVYVSALTTLNLDDHNRIRTTDMRLLRRMVRDHQFRSTPPEDTISRWPSVRRGETRYIFPYQEDADVIFNSSLAYELSVLKPLAYPLLKAVPKTDPGYSIARRMTKFLNYIYSTSDLSDIPPISLIREFVGGSKYDV